MERQNQDEEIKKLYREVRILFLNISLEELNNSQVLTRATCRICDKNTIGVTLGCGHVFCSSCVQDWKKCHFNCKEPFLIIKLNYS